MYYKYNIGQRVRIHVLPERKEKFCHYLYKQAQDQMGTVIGHDFDYSHYSGGNIPKYRVRFDIPVKQETQGFSDIESMLYNTEDLQPTVF